MLPFRPPKNDETIKGLWWDLPPRHSTEEALDLALYAGIREVCIDVGRQGETRVDSLWSPKELAAFVRKAHSRHVLVSVMYWPMPTPESIENVKRATPQWVEAGAWATEADCEGGNWSDKYIKGFRSLDEAGDALLDAARHPDLMLGANFHTGRLSLSVSSKVDYVAIQAYSRYKESDTIRHWGAPYGPGNAQKRAWNLAQKADPKFTIMGLAAYSQAFPGHRAHEAMSVAADSAKQAGARWLRYWSAKHVVGPDRNSYPLPFIASLK